MDSSVFMDKAHVPAPEELKQALDNAFTLWQDACKIVHDKYPGGEEEWTYSGKNHGWSFRIKDKKRAIMYLLPRKKGFSVAFVFGQKAVDKVMKSNVSKEIKNDLAASRVYMEGRGVRVNIKNEATLKDVAALVEIKLDS